MGDKVTISIVAICFAAMLFGALKWLCFDNKPPVRDYDWDIGE